MSAQKSQANCATTRKLGMPEYARRFTENDIEIELLGNWLTRTLIAS